VSTLLARATSGVCGLWHNILQLALCNPVLLAPAHARRGAAAQGSGIPYQSPRSVPGHQPARGSGPDRGQEDTVGPAAFPGCRIRRAEWYDLARPGGARADGSRSLDGRRAPRGGQRPAFCPGHTVVDRERLYAALSAYLLSGIFFGVFYWVLEHTWSGSLAIPGEGVQSNFFTRAGDLLQLCDADDAWLRRYCPRSEVARGLAIMEALVGQLYLAVMVARLVSLGEPLCIKGRQEKPS